MASRKMTFTLPEDLAAQLLNQVPARDRSRYVTGAIAAKLRQREQRLIHACDVANADADVLVIERDWEALPDEITEPWTDAPAR
jgi:hypothetical protein